MLLNLCFTFLRHKQDKNGSSPSQRFIKHSMLIHVYEVEFSSVIKYSVNSIFQPNVIEICSLFTIEMF
jgi:hypothetical protein